ncbi:hypothetical protein RJI07_05210 [Mycoplasmatota bacterium WC30]
MIRIQLTPREKQLFLSVISLSNYKIKYNFDGNDISISEDVNNLEQITYLLLDCFCSKGLNDNDEPNSLGEELENLNSKFIKQLQILNDSNMLV